VLSDVILNGLEVAASVSLDIADDTDAIVESAVPSEDRIPVVDTELESSLANVVDALVVSETVIVVLVLVAEPRLYDCVDDGSVISDVVAVQSDDSLVICVVLVPLVVDSLVICVVLVPLVVDSLVICVVLVPLVVDSGDVVVQVDVPRESVGVEADSVSLVTSSTVFSVPSDVDADVSVAVSVPS